MTPKRPRRGLIFFATVALFLILGAVFVLPPAPRRVSTTAAADPRIVKGAIHIHTNRSDGGGTMDDVAAAAARAGLQFVIVTDHGDGRDLLPPGYRSGVLCIDGAEISTDDGHLVAMGLRPPEYRLAGEGRDVIEDIHRLGGVAIVAHPESPKRTLAWRDWAARFDGIEWLNGDAEWRDESAWTLARLALAYPVRAGPAIAAAFDRPIPSLERFDVIAARRAIVAIAAHDAHARIGGDDQDAYGAGARLPVPSYEAAFRAFAVRVILDAPLDRDAEAAAAAVVSAIRHGRVFTAIDGIAAPARIAFTARSGSATAEIGGRLIPAGPVSFEIEADAPSGSTLALLHEGREVASGPPPRLVHQQQPDPGAYRAEVWVPGSPGTPPVPWILTSSIHVGIPSGGLPEVPPIVRDGVALSRAADLPLWRVEHQPDSSGEVSSSGADNLLFTYALGDDVASSPYAALVRAVSLPPGSSAMSFRARADRPMRLSVQLRSSVDRGARWRRSVFLNEVEREIRIDLAGMRPADGRVAAPPPADRVDALLFVADTVNTDPGASGWVSIRDVRVGEASANGARRP
jgi:predicted metal-dependent phosphoesterase TrpH